MKTFDFESHKYTMIIIAICLFFAFFIFKAFQYIPEDPENNDAANNSHVTENINTQQNIGTTSNNSGLEQLSVDNDNENNENVNNETNSSERKTNLKNLLPRFEESEIVRDEDKAFHQLLDARELKNSRDYKKAISEYSKVEKLTQDRELIAQSYDSICEIYIILDNLPEALNYARRANDMVSTPGRNFMIAKINYSMGDKEDAFNRLEILMEENKRSE